MNRLCMYLLALVVGLAAVSIRAEDAGQLTAENMKVALHTATPQENGFIERVLDRVQRGTMPLDLVKSTFQWARKKPRKQFYYFKQGLILRAAEQGIHIQ
ncbi:MAG: hypothetical protein LLG00_15975 [Planctomycetaceae bacterium]|nr:hypothetical protein [Planctomycetaceae bacterium]